MVVHAVLGSRRGDVAPAAGDGEGVVLDLEEVEGALGAIVDEVHQLGERRLAVKVHVRLPVGATRHRFAHGAFRLDRLFQGLIERLIGLRRQVDSPDQGSENLVGVRAGNFHGRLLLAGADAVGSAVSSPESGMQKRFDRRPGRETES